MKIIWTIIRWVLGVIFCLASIGGFASNETGPAFFILILGLLLLPPVTKLLFGTKKISNNSDDFQGQSNQNREQQGFKSQLRSLPYPDRIDAIVWHINAIEKSLDNGNLNQVNLSYAKLIESIKQQNVNDSGKSDSYLKSVISEYEEFRSVYNLPYPEQFLPSSKPKEKSKTANRKNIVNLTSKSEGNTTTFTIDLNEEELLKRLKNGEIGRGNSNRQKSIDNITGFYGSKQYSDNKEYCVVYCDGHSINDKWKNGKLALIKKRKLLFEKSIQRPNDCYVSNNGFVICCDWLNAEELAGRFIIFDINGEIVFSKKTTANLGACGISNDSKIAIFETNNSDTEDGDKIFIIDIEERKILNKFERPTSFNSAVIDTATKRIELIDHKKFIFEIDFEGNQTNTPEYEEQIMEKGTVYDKLWLYSTKTDHLKFNDEKYLDILELALTDKNASYSYGKDRIYRMIGEYYEAQGKVKQTIENWEKAIELNPKVGVKRKLNALKKKE
ncbi:tetratricopeptide repeat protein [Sinomicrobium oceani]|uniref:tetratricopeptide repeat protein n=1 Tax=Sinomicrobium oceani TaxID=1150368 RepID=UPI00227C4AF2|nr:tetratricopeptide repeat protein [Sinomicrobium oceani]